MIVKNGALDLTIPAPAPTTGDSDWFVRDRFGLFIHWGLYALSARHEWVRHYERIANEQYDEKYFTRFDPDLYDPKQWAKAADDAGMKYFVITTKHHEGFCLWDTQLSDYKATRTPAGRDLLRPMVEAFRERGLRTGFYHSLIDWHHPQYVIDSHIGPHRDDPKRAEMNAGRDQAKYIEYLHGQVRELLTGYGKVDLMWLDFSYPKGDVFSGKAAKDWDSEHLVKLVRKLCPKIMLNDRLDLPESGDFRTPEQFQPSSGVTVGGKPVVWEACQTFSGSWGYSRDESSWKSVEQLLLMLIDTVSKGGNLLLNVGPTGRGEFDERALARLSGMGEWMKRHSRSIYGCTQAPASIRCPRDCRLTFNPETRRVYVHVLAWPFRHLHLPGLKDKVAYAQLLNDASEVQMKGLEAWQETHQCESPELADALTLELPVRKPNVTIPVIELFLK
jgi:alpha-L-fucosidase